MRLAFTAAVVLMVTTFAFGYSELVVDSASSRVFDDPARIEPHEVVIVPGAGLTVDRRPGYYLSRRLECALELYRQGKARHILVSGDNGEVSYDEPSAMHGWLVGRGVPESAITRDFAGFRTRDTMERARRVFGVRRAIICTQALHARRSAFLAHDAGMDASVLVAEGDRFLGFGPRLRERIAILGAVFDAIVDREPRYLGAPVDLGAR
ncbi:MAG TPA: ElyC/SanA/YdcF family protein [Myxococcota bacterium]|nr:ElyC/SanA/YdcF family protein [Myxococcota bacterium]